MARAALTWKTMLGVVAGVAAASLASRAAASSARRYSPKFVRTLTSLVEQASQWSVVSEQDGAPLMQLMHVNYALAYANVARRLAPNGEASRVAKVDLDELIYALEERQMQAMQRVAAECPSLQPDGLYAVSSGWIA